MYILTHDAKQIVNSEFVERLCVAAKDDAALVIASYDDKRPPVTLTRCATLAEAKDALYDLLTALSAKQRHYIMPETLYYAAERKKKDARTKRKGGS